jgi:uncharacterized membrane protein
VAWFVDTMLKTTLRILLALFFIGAGINHFVRTGFYLRMMPPYVPFHLAMVQISGGAEILLGLLIAFRRPAPIAAWGLIALLVAVFPANVQMALHPETFPEFSARALWLRLPLQPVMIAWAFWYTRRNRRDHGVAETITT